MYIDIGVFGFGSVVIDDKTKTNNCELLTELTHIISSFLSDTNQLFPFTMLKVHQISLGH